MAKRYVLVNEIKPERLNDYIAAHERMHESEWKEQLDVLRKAGAKACDSYVFKNYAILVYECDDIDDSFAKLGQDPRRRAWEDFTQPMFATSPKFDGSEKVAGLRKIFDLNAQMDRGVIDQY
ncbi:MAG: L-rhamnose mutarotase [Planctomycetota bacterium]|jgi:L-rhamnose mutarotase|nr:L-rhamnose mutarotase [Planctomycetota bacterium]